MAENFMSHETETVHHGEEEESHPAHAIVFPWFVEAVGLLVFFLLSRKIDGLPYTAVMFVIGVAMGIGAIYKERHEEEHDILSESILMWSRINAEVLLVTFLPGLIFRDALNVDFHLFTIGLSQILTMAFIMVLAGTMLTACVGFYIFPYEWSWFFSLTFGAILAATDPVAVAAILQEVGAPPRLSMHISGESMFNDGSAIVFYTIFSGMFLHELNIEGVGKTFGIAEGFAEFFRLALGGAAIGLAFAICLVGVLYVLDQRLDKETNVVQVAATVSVAYLTFFVSEVAAGCSGIIAVVVCGITTNAFGSGFINDPGMMEDFWSLLEHLLNTLLFNLGGVVFGTIIANTDERDDFDGRDWGYLLLLYALLHVIRFALFGMFYPLLSNIGLKTNWQETVFLSFAGLRGAIGIALAIAIDNSVRSATEDPEQRAYTNKLFGMMGGVAMLTLVVNGTLAKPLLKRLGLAKSSKTHKVISEHYRNLLKKQLMREAALLLQDSRFSEHCSYKRIRYHLKSLRDVTDEEFEAAKEKAIQHNDHKENLAEAESSLENLKSGEESSPKMSLRKSAGFGENELRLLFIQLLRGAYAVELDEGFLDARIDNGMVHYALSQSLDFAADKVNRGGALEDWQYTSISEMSKLNYLSERVAKWRSSHTSENNRRRISLLKAFAFQTAHQHARKVFEEEFIEGADDPLSAAAQEILKESKMQEDLASNVIKKATKIDLEIFVSHYICMILLNKGASLIHKHNRLGMVKDQEAHHILEETEENIKEIVECKPSR